uniref:Glycosyltransferase 2-like domain-containing protein n=1 Tax=Hanusia phi TaxID=3032 RepID=A0A7S0I230_9CRYP|mmetsp:Transcript_8358/g.18996  ORF Transcript_8358/g.18996 Transcript_8358/m.18996 type:complete len:376 (+) Transcript_8358:68-1195(+)
MIGNRHSAAARFLLFILLCTTCTDAQDEEFVKLVGLVPVRDEAHLLPSCLRALSRLVHAIVVLDDCSVDGSAKVAHELEDECKIERVERSKTCKRDAKSGLVLPFWGNEAAHRSYLLELGRSIGGTHFLAIDSDEVVVVGGGKKEELDEFRNIILRMKKGDLLVLHYITMFSSAKKFREDKADFKAVGFVDQNRARYRKKKGDDPLHTQRIPSFEHPGQVWEFRFDRQSYPPAIAVLHFGFSNLPNARMKNVMYNFFDIISLTKKTRQDMNDGVESQGLTAAAEASIVQTRLMSMPQQWERCLQGWGFDFEAFESPQVAKWRELLILAWLSRDEGPFRFRGLKSLELLRRHFFSSLSHQDAARTRALLARLERFG